MLRSERSCDRSRGKCGCETRRGERGDEPKSGTYREPGPAWRSRWRAPHPRRNRSSSCPIRGEKWGSACNAAATPPAFGAPHADSTGVGPPVSKETRINVGATRVGNLFARLQLHLATARFLAELRADALWETACADAALELDTLASGMAPEALAAPLHTRVPPSERGDGDRMSRTPAHALACALEGRRWRRSGTRRISAPAAPDLPAITARHFARPGNGIRSRRAGHV